MKKAFKLFLTAIAIVGGLNKVEAQLLPIRVGYTALAGSFTPLWIAKELGLFERQGIQCSPIYMASTLAYQAMLAGETNFAGRSQHSTGSGSPWRGGPAHTRHLY